MGGEYAHAAGAAGAGVGGGTVGTASGASDVDGVGGCAALHDLWVGAVAQPGGAVPGFAGDGGVEDCGEHFSGMSGPV